MRTGSNAQQPRWFARSQRLDDPASVPDLARATVFWRRAGERESVIGFGISSVLEGPLTSVLTEAAATEVRWVGPRPPGVPGPWFGGFAFDGGRPGASEWMGFGRARFVIPEVVVVDREGERLVVTYSTAENGDRRNFRDAPGASAVPPRKLRLSPFFDDSPRGAWEHGVHAALTAMQTGELGKVVLARRIRARFATPVRAADLVEALAARNPECIAFGVVTSSGLFAGATPETLLRLDGRTARVDALAGTLAPGESRPTEKELREHAFVVAAAREALAPCAASVTAASSPEVLQLRHVAHLRTPVVAELAEDVSLADVVARLHPTPAVCGTPRDAALDFIRRHEDFDRGWYAGAVGWIGENAAHLAVAIRSTLVRGADAWVYTGAGLVDGSTPEREWEETARKSRAVLDALEALS